MLNMVSARSALDREPPAAVEQGIFDPPAIHRHTLDGGLQFWGIENHTIPVITLSWLAPAGSQFDPEGLAGLASLVSPLVLEGTKKSSGSKIVEGTRQLGSRILSGFDWDGAFLSFDCLEEDLDQALGLVIEVALTPVFPDSALEGWRRRRLVQVARRRKDPSARLQDIFAAAVYGEGIYGRSMLGSEASLRQITGKDLSQFHSRHFGPKDAFVLAVGNLRADEMAERVAAALANCDGEHGDQKAEHVASIPAAAPVQGDEQRCVVSDHPGAVQTMICIGHASVPRSHPDIAYLDILNAVLAGMYTSRLNLELRERLGYTYEIRSQLGERRGPAPFSIRVAVAHQNVGATVRVILEEMDRLRQEPISDEELKAAQGFQRGRVIQRFQTGAWILRQMHRQALLGLETEHERRYQEDVASINRSQLMEMAKKYLHPNRAVIAAVGPEKILNNQLEPWIKTGRGEKGSDRIHQAVSSNGDEGK